MDTDSAPTFPEPKQTDMPPEQSDPDGVVDSDESGAETDNDASQASDIEDSDIEGSDIEGSDIEGTDIEGTDDEVESPGTIEAIGLDGEDLDSDEDIDDDDDKEYLQKFDHTVRAKFIEDYHPQSLTHNYEEVLALVKVTRGPDGQIIDALHRTIPILTKYERTRILGQRAAQLNSGAQPLVPVPTGVLQGYVIAELELKSKKIPFIIRRPLPNRGSEYWRVSDLELL